MEESIIKWSTGNDASLSNILHLVTIPPSQKQMTIMCKSTQQKAVHTLVTLLISISSGSNKDVQEWICLFSWQHSHKNRFKSALKNWSTSSSFVGLFSTRWLAFVYMQWWSGYSQLIGKLEVLWELRIQVCLYVSRSEWFLTYWSHRDRSKCREPFTRRNSFAHQKTWTLSNSSVRTSDPARYIFGFTMTAVWCTCV